MAILRTNEKSFLVFMNKQHQSDLFTEENLRTIAGLLIDLPGSELRVMQILAQMDTG